jgi:hypothetical protein
MKSLKIFVLAALAVLVGAGAAQAAGPYGDPCTLITNLGGIFRTLRTLCFAGAAFMIMGWAWGYIMKPDDLDMDKVKKKGVGLLVGFALLFGIGIILQFLPGIAGCNLTAFN